GIGRFLEPAPPGSSGESARTDYSYSPKIPRFGVRSPVQRFDAPPPMWDEYECTTNQSFATPGPNYPEEVDWYIYVKGVMSGCDFGRTTIRATLTWDDYTVLNVSPITCIATYCTFPRRQYRACGVHGYFVARVYGTHESTTDEVDKRWIF